MSLLDVLPEILQANSLAKKKTLQLAIKDFDSDLDNGFCNRTKHGKLFYNGTVLCILEIQALWMKFLKKHYDVPLTGSLAVKK